MTPEEREWRQQAFLDWLCTIKEERVPEHQYQLAEKLNMSESTLSAWKKEPDFLARWDAQYRRTTGSPERMQRVLDMLYETATDRSDPRQVAAAKEYRNAVEGVSPQQYELTIRKDLAQMTDEEFREYEALAAQAIVREVANGSA